MSHFGDLARRELAPIEKPCSLDVDGCGVAAGQPCQTKPGGVPPGGTPNVLSYFHAARGRRRS